MSMNVLAIAGSFSIYRSTGESLEVYGTFWIELFLAYHKTFGMFLIRAGI